MYSRLKISHLNINGLRGKIDDIRMAVQECPPDVLTFSETKLDEDVAMKQLHIQGYNFFIRNRDGNGAGCACYVSKS